MKQLAFLAAPAFTCTKGILYMYRAAHSPYTLHTKVYDLAFRIMIGQPPNERCNRPMGIRLGHLCGSIMGDRNGF